MNPEAQNYMEHLDTLRGRAKAAIEGMDAEELNWAPLNVDTNSPCALASHIAGAETMWVHYFAGGLEINRDREAEFRARPIAPLPLFSDWMRLAPPPAKSSAS